MSTAPVPNGKTEEVLVVVGVAIVRMGGFRHGRQVLLLKRRLSDGREFYTFPGGKLESGESLIQALMREVREGLNCRSIGKLEFITNFQAEGLPGVMVNFFLYWTETAGAMKFESKEYVTAQWLEFEVAVESSPTPATRLGLLELRQRGLI